MANITWGIGPGRTVANAPRTTNYWEYNDPAQRAAAYAEQTASQAPTGATQNAAQQAASDAMFSNVSRLTEGRANELKADPVNAEIVKYLKSIMGGGSVPYNDQTLNAMKAQFGKGAATAEGAQMDQLREALGAGGGSIYDPSYQAASREQESQRQAQNLDYGGQLDSQANLANFQARQGAAAQLAAVNASQNSQINNLGLAGAGYQAQRFQEAPGGGLPTTLMPQYQPQAAAAPAVARPAAAPKPTAAPTQLTASKTTAPAPTGSAQIATAPTATPLPKQTIGNNLSYGDMPQNDAFDFIRSLMDKGGTARWA